MRFTDIRFQYVIYCCDGVGLEIRPGSNPARHEHFVNCFSKRKRFAPRFVANLDPRRMVDRISRHCYTQNIKDLVYVVSEKKIFLNVSLCKYMEATDPQVRAILIPAA